MYLCQGRPSSSNLKLENEFPFTKLLTNKISNLHLDSSKATISDTLHGCSSNYQPKNKSKNLKTSDFFPTFF